MSGSKVGGKELHDLLEMRAEWMERWSATNQGVRQGQWIWRREEIKIQLGSPDSQGVPSGIGEWDKTMI